VSQLFNNRTTFPNTAVLSILCNFVVQMLNADWSILVYATKLQCTTCTVAYCNNFVQYSCTTKLRVWHQSKNNWCQNVSNQTSS